MARRIAREYATQFSRYLKEVLLCIERAKDQPVSHGLAKTMAMGALCFVNKIHNIPDIGEGFNQRFNGYRSVAG
ncbi:hypothetical protein BFJ70_g16530 [Fusarium oxysporum]|uniref:Uncharacterized protein n=2 Tax=Fusarium oxysporum TaxID=5507 RepID=A0A420NE95_FUSOX|nr:hypothetical protein FOMA001_g13777 [Fusarium oxysporum f. sp. matthiolae]RKK08407.1 hypothetical protein BFJ65_g17069 [Fusarium oxysporum f. sp. cepae]RKK78592.1 hypothetical protein BFJ68_g17877 [Fusarium oxysporum]RKK31083.1 hypothetical protein BFJ67_g15413 [Fusarium oxysporum f. sp. cepae]RKK32523.1 hypothetical protein BFJ66_g15329 [Fusarium oxysporum f. sp. cepae]